MSDKGNSMAVLCSDARHRSISSADLLHHIRALTRDVRVASSAVHRGPESGMELLAAHLKSAMAVRSPLNIAVVLGCAAEMSVFPPAPVLEQCTETVFAANQPALRGVLWAVRHRHSKAGANARCLHL